MRLDSVPTKGRNETESETVRERNFCLCRSVKHSVAKFFGVADEDEAKRAKTVSKWQASSRRLQNRSFLLSRRPSQRRTAPRTAAAARSASAAEYEMARRQAEQYAPEPTMTPDQLLSSGGYDSVDGGMPSETGSIPPHPLDPHAQPPVYDAFLLISLKCRGFEALKDMSRE